MNNLLTDGAVLSPLAQQLQTLINQGIVQPSPHQENLFPTAMTVVPVYDSTSSSPFFAREASR